MWSFVTKRDCGSRIGEKRTILASRNYWTAPYLISVLKTLIKENKIFHDVRISVDLADSAIRYRGIFEGWKVGCITYVKIYIKKGLIPWTEIIMGDECSIWVAKHIFPRTLWFLRNWQGLYPLGPNKCYPVALLYDIKFGITFLSFIYNPSQYISEKLYFFFILPIITICFTCGETKSLSNIKISQNIMTRIVWKAFFCILCLN